MPNVITASARTTRSLLLRVSRLRTTTAPNDPDASGTEVPGKYDWSRNFNVYPLLKLFTCTNEIIFHQSREGAVSEL
jgi:hypothetical protein